MKALFLDIETLPADVSDAQTLITLKHLFEKKIERKKKKEISDGVVMEEEVKKLSFDEFVNSTSFDGGLGRVLCIALAKDNEPVLCHSSIEGGVWDEKRVLEWFWEVAKQCDFFVGHNILEFDLRFLWQRSIVAGVKPSWQDSDGRSPKYLSFAKYRNFPVYDVMHEWVKWGRENVGLEHMALSLGVPSPKDGIDGSQVASFFEKGEVDKICEYCKRDVETTRAIYKKMDFQP